MYAISGLSSVAIDQAYLQIINELPANPGMKQVSMSYGFLESQLSLSQLTTDASYFALMVASNVTPFAATGDFGSEPLHTTGNTTITPESPATDPSVTAVGGTSVFLDSGTGAVTSELAWSGSGGGISKVANSRQVWQTGTGVPTGTTRLVPDVAAIADPNTSVRPIIGGQTVLLGNEPGDAGMGGI